MRHYALAAALLISAPAALAQSGQSDTDKTPTQQEIWQGKLYEWLTEMVLARDELLGAADHTADPAVGGDP